MFAPAAARDMLQIGNTFGIANMAHATTGPCGGARGRSRSRRQGNYIASPDRHRFDGDGDGGDADKVK